MLFVWFPDGSLFSCGSLARICPQVIITLMYFLPVSISSCYLLHLRVQQIWQTSKMQKVTELPQQKHLLAWGWGVKELGLGVINNKSNIKTAEMQEILFADWSISLCSAANQGQERWWKQNWSCLFSPDVIAAWCLDISLSSWEGTAMWFFCFLIDLWIRSRFISFHTGKAEVGKLTNVFLDCT